MADRTRIRVMIVEDEPAFQELVQLMLSLDPQFEVVGRAGTGEEALEELASAQPDLVLLDFRLPGIDGLETGKQMKNRCPGLKVVIVTAHSEEVLRRFAREARIDAVIPKASFSLDQLYRLVGRV